MINSLVEINGKLNDIKKSKKSRNYFKKNSDIKPKFQLVNIFIPIPSEYGVTKIYNGNFYIYC